MMFMIFLRFSANKQQSGDFLEEHKAWIKSGFDDGVFLLAGAIEPGLGGAIAAHNTSRQQLGERLDRHPYIANDVVTAEIVEINPAITDPRLQFLKSA